VLATLESVLQACPRLVFGWRALTALRLWTPAARRTTPAARLPMCTWHSCRMAAHVETATSCWAARLACGAHVAMSPLPQAGQLGMHGIVALRARPGLAAAGLLGCCVAALDADVIWKHSAVPGSLRCAARAQHAGRSATCALNAASWHTRMHACNPCGCGPVDKPPSCAKVSRKDAGQCHLAAHQTSLVFDASAAIDEIINIIRAHRKTATEACHRCMIA
jgi:hypothetical protein